MFNKKRKKIISTNTDKLPALKCFQLVLLDIWKSIPTQKFFQTTTFNYKLTNENGVDGYKWYPEINMSVQNTVNTLGTLNEIINMIKINKMSIILSIFLEDYSTLFIEDNSIFISSIIK